MKNTTLARLLLGLVIGLCLVVVAMSDTVIYQRGYDDAIRQVAACTLADAHADKCFIPCSTDLDCVAKNGQEDH